MSKNKIIVIAGPTASGKSDLANHLANNINAEIISADSMQIYKGIDIGTGKISESERLVKHWGIDICDLDKPFSVAKYQKYARNCIEDIFKRKKNVVICGGTGFYIRSIIDDYNYTKPDCNAYRNRNYWLNYLKEYGSDCLYEKLKELDYESAKIIHPNNTIRVIRAIELYYDGLSYAKNKQNLKTIKQIYKAHMFLLSVDKNTLNKRINKRVDNMIKLGLVEEVKYLKSIGLEDALISKNAIGYKQILNFLNGNTTLDIAIEEIKLSTRQYAKRQRSWFRHDKRYKMLEYDNINIKGAINKIIQNIEG